MGFNMRRLRVFLLAFLLSAVAPWALAQAVPATAPIPRVAFPVTTAGNVASFGMKTADAANAANFSFGVAANGSIFASAPDRLPTPGGASIPVTVGGSIPKASVAAALGRFAKKTLPVLSVGVALYDLGQELGYGVEATPDGALFSGAPPGVYVSTGNYWRANNGSYNGYGWSPEAACRALAGSFGATFNYVVTAESRCVATTPQGYPFGGNLNIQSATVSCPSGYFVSGSACQAAPFVVPVTTDQFVQAVNARASWPQSSALARATVDAINAGESLGVYPEIVTGPSTSPGPVTQSVNETAGETTVSTTTNHHTYQGASVTTNVVTVNTTTNNSTGAVINSSTVTQSPVLAPPAAEPAPLEFPCGGPGLPACSVKVDETGTPATVTMPDPFPQMQSDQADKLAEIAAADGTAWEPIKDLFFLPSATQCVPFEMPVVMGAQVPPIDPCPVVGGIQQVVGVLWYIAGFWIMLGWVREVV